MDKNNDSDEFETISEHSVDSQGNTIKSDSQKESDYETVEEESYGSSSESMQKTKKQPVGKLTVKGSNKIKQSPHFKKIKSGKT